MSAAMAPIIRAIAKQAHETQVAVVKAAGPSIATVQYVVSTHYGISIDDLRGPGRARRYSRPRQVAVALARDLTGKSFRAIGRLFGGRNHSSMVKARHAALRTMLVDYAALRAMVMAEAGAITDAAA